MIRGISLSCFGCGKLEGGGNPKWPVGGGGGGEGVLSVVSHGPVRQPNGFGTSSWTFQGLCDVLSPAIMTINEIAPLSQATDPNWRGGDDDDGVESPTCFLTL